MTIPWYVRPILLRPKRIAQNLERLRSQGFEEVPNLWQVSLFVFRMWHRMAFRPETIGTCKEGKPRTNWRARAFENRALRLPFLLAEGAVVPMDLTGLASSPDRIIRHLLGAHHDELQFLFDLEILDLHGQLPRLQKEVKELIDKDDARTRRLRDLVVFEGYHEQLLAAVNRALSGTDAADPAVVGDPDISFLACMRWCARQPSTPTATLKAFRQGRFALDSPLAEASQ